MDSSEIDYDSEPERSDVFASSTKSSRGARGSEAERPKTPSAANKVSPPFDAEEVREAALRKELEGVRDINQVIEGVIGTLERAKGNMGVGNHVLKKLGAVLIYCRLCPKPLPTRPLSSTRGPASCRRPNIISA
jgi:hypothetical protein